MVLIKKGEEEKLNLNPRVFMNIKEDEQELGRIVIELYKHKVPQLAEDMRSLFTGERGIGKKSGIPLNLKNNSISQIIKGMGANIEINDEVITLSEKEMAQDNYYNQTHDEAGLVSYSSYENNSDNKSYISLCLRPNTHLDNKNIVFGKIVYGIDVLNMLEVTRTNKLDEPLTHIFIVNCGQLILNLPTGVAIRLSNSDLSDKKRKNRKEKNKKSKHRYLNSPETNQSRRIKRKE